MAAVRLPSRGTACPRSWPERTGAEKPRSVLHDLSLSSALLPRCHLATTALTFCRSNRLSSFTLRQCRSRGVWGRMRSTAVVSRPSWVHALNSLSGTGGASRKSPIEIFATAASVVAHSSYAEVTGVRTGRLGRLTDGVETMRQDRLAFASYWDDHNERVIRARATEAEPGPLWVAIGDSTAQG